jgi:hypothetical protein
MVELEQAQFKSNILKNTALWDVNLGSKKLKTELNHQETKKQSQAIHQETFTVDDEEYAIRFEQGHFSQIAHGDGLRMSNMEDKYLALIPKQIIALLEELNINLVLDKKFPLIKDRSRLALEGKYLKDIQKAIAQGTLFIAIKELIKNRRKFIGWPDDYFNNPDYYLPYEGDEGNKIKQLATTINQNQMPEEKDWQWLSDAQDPTSKLARLAALLEIELEDPKTKEKYITTLQAERIELLKKIQAQIGNSKLESILQQELGISRESGAKEKTVGSESMDQIMPSFAHSLDVALAKLERKTEIIKDEALNEKERAALNQLREIVNPVWPKLEIQAGSMERSAGEFKRNFGSAPDKFIIDRELLNGDFKQLIETAVHELTHYEEGTENHSYEFTHQVLGNFGRIYKETVNRMTHALTAI